MATNEQIIDRLDSVLSLVRENKTRIDDIEPLVKNHHLVLYGDPADRKDQGMVGAFNAMEDLFITLKNWGRGAAGTAVVSLVIWAAKAALDIYVTYQSLP